MQKLPDTHVQMLESSWFRVCVIHGCAQARNILIATGCKAVKAPIEGSEHGIISDDVLSLERIPDR